MTANAELGPDQVDVLSPWGQAGPPPPGAWTPDLLGAGFECRTLPLLPDDEGEAVATLVRHVPKADPIYGTGMTPWLPLPSANSADSAAATDPTPRAAILYMHGRNDYFFQTELARELSAAGLAFYALDLRKYGRSLRPGQTIGWVDSLNVYDEEIGEAIALIRRERPGIPLLMMGHSTGGLIALLWAYRHPGVLRSLILNSAWLELQTYTAMRPAMQQVLGRLAAMRPRTVVMNSKNDVYFRSLHQGWAGTGMTMPPDLLNHLQDPAVTGWSFAPEWKRPQSFPVLAGWLLAILSAQDEVAQRVKVDCPVLSFASTESTPEDQWSDSIFSTDIVLDANLIALRSARISDLVTIARLPGKHDLTLSDPQVRARFYDLIRGWLTAVGI